MSELQSRQIISGGERNYQIDLIRTVACVAVIGLHTYRNDSSLLNALIYYLSGFAVPYFFMASGFFLLNRGKIDIHYSIKKISGIMKVIVTWNCLYGFTKVAKDVLVDGESIVYVLQIPGQCVKSLIQKGTFWQFWFLGALMLVYLALPLITRLDEKHKFNMLLYLGVASITLEVLSFVKGYPIQKCVIQTFRLWTWLFYFLLGGFIEKIKVVLLKNISTITHCIIYVLFSAVLVIYQIYIGTFVITDYGVSLNAEFFYDDLFEMIWIILGFSCLLRLNTSFSYFFREISANAMGIYIVHPFVIRVLKKVISGNSFSETSILFGATLLCSLVIVMMIQKTPLEKWLIRI